MDSSLSDASPEGGVLNYEGSTAKIVCLTLNGPRISHNEPTIGQGLQQLLMTAALHHLDPYIRGKRLRFIQNSRVGVEGSG